MSIKNYAELKTAIADWLNRTDLEARIPDFITLCEAAIYRQLRSTNNEKLQDYVFDSNGVTNIKDKIPVPSDYLQPRLLSYNDVPLTRISEAQYLKKLKESDAAREPKYYTRIHDELLFYPKFDGDEQDAKVQLWYYFRPPALDVIVPPATSSDTNTNDVLLNSPDLYLFGSLLQAQAYLIGDERLGIWGTQYQVALDQQTELSEDEDYLGSTVQVESVYEM
jgi:hypothetical protein